MNGLYKQFLIITLLSTLLSGSSLGADRFQVGGVAEIHSTNREATGHLKPEEFRNPLVESNIRLYMDYAISEELFLLTQSDLYIEDIGGESEPYLRLRQAYFKYLPKSRPDLSVSLGRVFLPFGDFTKRYTPDLNPLIGNPIYYDRTINLLSHNIPTSPDELIEQKGNPIYKHFDGGGPYRLHEYLSHINYVPYPTGLFATQEHDKFSITAGLMNSSPVSPQTPFTGDDHLNLLLDGRYIFNEYLTVGASLAYGPYLRGFVSSSLPEGRDITDYKQQIYALYGNLIYHYTELRTELIHSSYDIPNIYENVKSDAFYAEIKGKHPKWPRLWAAARVGAIRNSRIGYTGGRDKWDLDSKRGEIGFGFRINPDASLKLSYQMDDWDFTDDWKDNKLSAQFMVTF